MGRNIAHTLVCLAGFRNHFGPVENVQIFVTDQDTSKEVEQGRVLRFPNG
jgi:hypothetical protein